MDRRCYGAFLLGDGVALQGHYDNPETDVCEILVMAKEVKCKGFVWRRTQHITRQGLTTQNKRQEDKRPWKTRQHKTTPDDARHNNTT